MMHVRTVVSIFAVLGWAVFATAAWANSACPQASAPTISVRMNDPGPTFDTSKDIKHINAMAGSHGLRKAGALVLGLTEVEMESRYEAQLKATPRQPGQCVQLNAVNLVIGLNKHVVHLPFEYKRGSCQYNVVMRHEMAHVDVNRRTLRKYASVMEAELRRTLGRGGYVYVSNVEQGKRTHDARIKTVVNGVVQRFNAELKSLHGAIDSPGSKYAAQNQCRSW